MKVNKKLQLHGIITAGKKRKFMLRQCKMHKLHDMENSVN